MSEVENLFRDAGIEYEDPMAAQGARAIWDGSLGGMDLEVNEQGDLLINSDELVKSEKLETTVEISEGEEGNGGDEELFGEELEIKAEAMDYIEGEDLIENGEVGGDHDDQNGEGGGDQGDIGEGEQVIDSNFRRCSICGQVKHKKSILRHVRLIHENVKVSCDSCGLQLNSEAKLHSHFEKVHCENEELPQVECSFCDKTFAGRAKASYHETTVHKAEVENEYSCTLCAKSYKTKPNLSRHVREKHRD